MKKLIISLCVVGVLLVATSASAQGLANTPWPVTRADGATTGLGGGAAGAFATPDWTAPIPVGGVTHGGISILPGGDLVWKAYDQAAVGGVYRFNVGPKTIAWGPGPATGTWAHGGVAVGTQALFYGSRDGTISVGALDYNGNSLWTTTLLDGLGATVQVRGTPLLNPSEERLYVRDAANDGILYCLNSGTGAQIWSFDMRAVVDPVDADPNTNDAFSSSFGMLTSWGSGAAGDMYLYHNSGDSDESIVVRDDGGAGTAVWSHNFYNPGWQNSWHGSQVYNDGYLYASTFADGGRDSFYKIDAATGNIMWSLNITDGGANHFCRPAMSPDGQTFYVGGHGGTVTAYDDNGATGAVRWQYASTFGTAEFNGYVSVTGTPGDTWIYAIGNDNLLYAFHDNGTQVIPLLAWKYQLGPVGYFGSWQASIDSDGGLYIAGGAGNAEDGNFILYHFPGGAQIPEPGVMALFGFGLLALLGLRRRK